MRFVIFGAGAVGGVVGVRLQQSGHDVALIARGAHLEAMLSSGLTLETPEGSSTHRLTAAATPAELGLDAADVVLLAVKSQDTVAALGALAEARPGGGPLVLLQNGVENERVALRRCADVYGAVVLIPAAHLAPGTVQAFGLGPLTGKIDVGRFPTGVDATVSAVTDALAASGFASLPNPQIMAAKYAKLIDNLANVPQALCGVGADGLSELIALARAEGESVLGAAGIDFLPREPELQPQRFMWQGIGEIAGRPRAGGSTWQSLMRGRSLESDYLTGEIVLQARLIGHPAPLNTRLLALIDEASRAGRRPGWITAAEIRARAGV
ncbi:ketopantoate reductase family protein [Conexibacter sp. DBS9H8]|uniref:ketopantoate reductase family protein n=1 Tax=Conexibacter sp. DBS9H8 TaxID=2937801 RepID=UPI00200C66CF|nr:2-dehydropantoate 2-reductase N-terminal domain-containing protein [Conexibacter sp. DBS9H8]